MGKNYGSRFTMFGISKKLEITKKIFSEYDFSRIRYLDESFYDSTYVHVLKLTFIVSESVYGTIFYQSNTGIEKSNFQVVWAYVFKPPFGILQFIYQKGNPDFGVIDDKSSTVLLKLLYIF